MLNGMENGLVCFDVQVFFGKQRITLYNSKYLENQLLSISINFTPKTSHSLPKKNGTFLGFPGFV